MDNMNNTMNNTNNTLIIEQTLYDKNNIPNICKVLNVLPMQYFSLKNSTMISYIDYNGKLHMNSKIGNNNKQDDIFFEFLTDSINDPQSILRSPLLSENECNFIESVYNILPNAQFFKISSSSPTNINFKFYDVSGNHLSSFYFTDKTSFPYLSNYDFDCGFSVKHVIINKTLIVYPKTSLEFVNENTDESTNEDIRN